MKYLKRPRYKQDLKIKKIFNKVFKGFSYRLLRTELQMTAAACLENSWLKEKLMRRKTAEINVSNQWERCKNLGHSFKVTNVPQSGAKESR